MRPALKELVAAVAGAALSACTWHGVIKQHPDIGWGGRAIAVAADPNDPSFILAASPTGGLFDSGMGGSAWGHINALHQFGCFDVEFSPNIPNLIVVTTIEDSRVENGGGIWVSRDRGATWTHPPSSIRRDSNGQVVPHSAFGISFVRGTRKVYVGTDDGLAVSQDNGTTWSFVQPTPSAPSREIYSVLGLTDGRVLTFGPAGLWMSDDGVNWYRDDTQIPFAYSRIANALAVSPLSNNDIFQTDDFTTLRYSPDGGRRWATIDTAPKSSAFRLPLVKIHEGLETRNSFDLYWAKEHGVFVKRVSAAAPKLDFSAPWTPVPFEHGDPTDLAFSRKIPNVGFAANDGGVEKSLDNGGTWHRVGTAANGFGAFQVHDVHVVRSPTSAGENDVYFGTMDVNLYASGDNAQTWPGLATPEGGALQGPAVKPAGGEYAMTYILAGPAERSGPLLSGGTAIDFQLGPFQINPVYYLSGNRFLTFAHSSGPGLAIWWSADGAANWTEVPGLRIMQDVKQLVAVSGPASNPSLIVPYQSGGESGPLGLLRVDNAFDGIDGNETVAPVPLPTGARLGSYGFGWVDFVSSFGVDPADPNFIILPDVASNRIYMTSDGGATWTERDDLLSLVTDGGLFKFSMPGSKRPDFELADSQVSAIQFDPLSSNRILLGTAEVGAFYSRDHGATWQKIPESEEIPNITSFAFTQVQSPETAYASSWGQGVWTLSLDIPPPEAGAPPPPPPPPPPPVPGAGAPLQNRERAVRGDRLQAQARFADRSPRLTVYNPRRTYSPGNVLAGQEMVVAGRDWVAAPGAQIEISVDGQVQKARFQVGADGTFVAELPAVEVIGRHVIDVTEFSSDRRILATRLRFSAMPDGERD